MQDAQAGLASQQGPAACNAPLDDEELDVIVRELDVYMCNEPTGLQMCLLAHPLRPPWRPNEYGSHCTARIKPAARRLEVDVPLDTSINYNKDEEGPEGTGGYKKIDSITLRSSQVEHSTLLAAGRILEDKVLLLPIDFSLQMRPTLSHLNVIRKEDVQGEGEGGADEEETGELKAVEVQVQKRETERQQQARLNSYAHMASKEAEEQWKPLQIRDEGDVHERVLDRLCKAYEGKQPHLPTTREAYLHAFAPSALGLPQGSATAHLPGREGTAPLSAGGSVAADGIPASGQGAEPASKAASLPPPGPITEEARTAFDRCMRALFMRHSVASLENVRQWLSDPKANAATGELKAAVDLAQTLMGLDNRTMHEMVMGSGQQLVFIRHQYVRKFTGKAEDTFRKIVVELLEEKEAFKKSEAVEMAKSLGIAITDTLYNKVVKDLCVSKNQAWHLKHGADL